MVFSLSSVSSILLASIKSLYLSVGREGIRCFYLSVTNANIHKDHATFLNKQMSDLTISKQRFRQFSEE